MSKNKKKPVKPSPKATPVSTIKEEQNYYKVPLASAQDPLYRRIFLFSLLFMLITGIILSLGSGINGDDEYQVDYSNKLVQYYSTMGADTSAYYIEKGNMHYYGGFFDLLTGMVNKTLGFDEFDTAYHQVRHIFNVLFGLLTILFVGLLTRELAGWRLAILALWLLFLSPRFIGHSLMNPKDIPFAAGFAISLYYMSRLFRQIPDIQWKTGLGVALGMALAIASRAGGLLLIGYLFLGLGLDLLTRYGVGGIFQRLKKVLPLAGYVLGISVVAYFLAVLTWPAALRDPLHHPLAALTEFSKLGVKIRLLFMGENVMSDDTVWYYPLIWIFKTIPIYALIGVGGALVAFPALLKRYSTVPVLLLYFASLFPLCYVIYKQSILHDGWRHLIFVYPSMIVLASLFFLYLEEKLKANKFTQYALWAILGLTLLEPALFIARNSHFPYVYFNPIAGGMKGALGNYETDYWGVSVKQAIDWLDKEGIISPEMNDTIYLGTTFYYNVSRQTREQYKGKVKVRYVRFNNRYSEDWQYGIFPSRYIRGPHLRSGTWPNSKTVHTIAANGVPLLAIEENKENWVYKGQEATKRADWTGAIADFEKELETHPDNELAWIGLANIYVTLGNNDKGLECAQQALKIAPDVENGLLYEGLAYFNKNDLNNAMTSFSQAIKVNEEYYIAHYYLGMVHEKRKDYKLAYEYAQKALENNPRFKQGYELAARALEALGNPQDAARYREAGSRF
ncbi:MAG TPA: tetratricopeptide repeat protein [Saprospiraceae bacterium]|nr:tetratricopeptide repeat protein [Saprospiraceae bacterium]HMQ84447.1 tetratricopeptide repeat protein [Saprospiraceae bacterium]